MTQNILFLILSILVIFQYNYVYSYCIYNHMDDNSDVFVYQSYGQRATAQIPNRRFSHTIASGAHECCPYDSTDCSIKPDKNHSVRIELFYSKDGQERGEKYTFNCPAGGYLVAKGTFDQFSYDLFDANNNRLE